MIDHAWMGWSCRGVSSGRFQEEHACGPLRIVRVALSRRSGMLDRAAVLARTSPLLPPRLGHRSGTNVLRKRESTVAAKNGIELPSKQWQTLQKGKCSDEGCAEEDRVSNARIEEPDFSLSILTCTEQANYEERSMSGGTAHNLVIEVIKTDYEF